MTVALSVDRAILMTAPKVTHIYRRWDGRCLINVKGAEDSSIPKERPGKLSMKVAPIAEAPILNCQG
jgi:hypothetical protein